MYGPHHPLRYMLNQIYEHKFDSNRLKSFGQYNLVYATAYAVLCHICLCTFTLAMMNPKNKWSPTGVNVAVNDSRWTRVRGEHFRMEWKLRMPAIGVTSMVWGGWIKKMDRKTINRSLSMDGFRMWTEIAFDTNTDAYECERVRLYAHTHCISLLDSVWMILPNRLNMPKSQPWHENTQRCVPIRIQCLNCRTKNHTKMRLNSNIKYSKSKI